MRPASAAACGGGRAYGRWPGLRPEQLFEGRDLAVTTEFRTLFSEVAWHHLGVPPAPPIFPPRVVNSLSATELVSNTSPGGAA